MAPLSAALANGDDTLSITADCYSTAGTDAAITAALLAYYTSSQVDTVLGDYRTGTAQDAETAGAITAALLAYYTSSQVDALLGDYRTGAAQDTQTQAAIAGLPDGPGPGRVHHQPNHLGAGGVPLSRRPGHGDGLEHRRRAAQLLHHRTSRRPPRRQARSLGAANSRALSGRRRGRRGGGRHRRADPGPHGRLTVKLDGPPQQRLQRGPGHAHRGSKRGRLHPDPGGEPVEHRAHLQLDAGPRAPLRLPLPARHGLHSWCTCPRPTTSTTHCTAALWATKAPGARPRCTSPCRQTELRGCTSERAGPAQPDGRNGGRLRPPDPGRNPGGRQHGGGGHGGLGAAARRTSRWPTLGEVLLEPTLTTLGNFLVRSNSQSSVASASFAVGGFQLEGVYAMTLSAFAWNIVLGRLLLRLPVPAGHGLQLGDVRQRGRQRLRGRHRHLPRHGLAGRLEHGAPGLLGAAKLHFGAFGGSIPGLVQQSAGTFLHFFAMRHCLAAASGPGRSVSLTLSSRRARWTCTACRSGPAPSRESRSW